MAKYEKKEAKKVDVIPERMDRESAPPMFKEWMEKDLRTEADIRRQESLELRRKKEAKEKKKPEEKTFTEEKRYRDLRDPETVDEKAIQYQEHLLGLDNETFAKVGERYGFTKFDLLAGPFSTLAQHEPQLKAAALATGYPLSSAQRKRYEAAGLEGYPTDLDPIPPIGFELPKQNVGKALSDKSLEELLQGKSALEQSIANDQAMLDQLGPVNTQTEKGRALAKEKIAAGAGLEAKYDLLDRIDVAIGVLEMDVEESTDLDADLR